MNVPMLKRRLLSGVTDKEKTMGRMGERYSKIGGAGCFILRLGVILLGVALLGSFLAPLAEAVPKQIIILRHGEKLNSYTLCYVGQQRSLALRDNYLGEGAANSLFPDNTGPDGIFAVTLHCLELASPSAQSWGIPIQLYSVVPIRGLTKSEETVQLNERTQQAASDLLTDPQWDGKTVVVVWEHDHIAKKKLEEQFPGEKVTLRQLLNLDALPEVPTDWPGGNYDYFWIVDYDNPGSPIPTGFTSQLQVFPKEYKVVPSNAWGTKERGTGVYACQP
jgi:hypothetical protein